MIWPDFMITEAAQNKGMIDPFNIKQVNPCSYDLTLSNWIRKPKYSRKANAFPVSLSPTNNNWPFNGQYWLEPEYYTSHDLQPGDFVLLSTLECLDIPRYVRGALFTKSSAGRIGLDHAAAGFVDCGFTGHLTFEMYNVAPWPIRIEPGMLLVQIEFAQMLAEPHRDYSQTGRYHNQGPQPEPARKEKR